MHRIIYRTSTPVLAHAGAIGAACRTTFLVAHERPYAVITFDAAALSSKEQASTSLALTANRHRRHRYSTLTAVQEAQVKHICSQHRSTASAPVLASSRTSNRPGGTIHHNTASNPPKSAISSSSPVSAVNKKPPRKWNPQLDALMVTLHETHHINWRTVGILLDRPFTTCYSRYLFTIRPAMDKGWTPPVIEDQVTLDLLIRRATHMANIAKAKRDALALSKKSAPKIAKKPVWDARTDQTIKEMVEAGNSWPEIGRALHRPYSSCYSRYYSTLDPELQFVWTDETVQRLKELASQGLPWKQVAQELKLRPLACRSKWSELGKPVSETISLPHPAGSSTSPSTRPIATVSTLSTGPTDASGDEKATRTRIKAKTIAFSQEESMAVLDLAEKHGEDAWDRVLQDFQDRYLQSIEPSLPPPSLKSRRQSNKRIRQITAENLRLQHTRLSRSKLLWTFDQETILIQQVLRLGTEGHWDEIARRTGFHSPQACRTRWKDLDMPVNPNPVGWSKLEQAAFWTLWQQVGTDYVRLSRFFSLRSAADCKLYFQHITKDFPDQDSQPDAFLHRIQDFQQSLPHTRRKYLFTKERSLRLQSAMRHCGMKLDQPSSPSSSSSVSSSLSTSSSSSTPATSVAVGTWSWVANKVQRGLSPSSAIDHWSYLKQNMDPIHGPLEPGQTAIKPYTSSSWTHEESKLLDQGIRELGSSWSEIRHRYLPWRTTRAIRQRYLIMSDKSTKVTEDEYYTILAAGNSSSEVDYDALAQTLPGWNRSPCRRIFETSYKHILPSTVWSPEEDRMLIERTLQEHSRGWQAIARHFDGVQTARAPLLAARAIAREQDQQQQQHQGEHREEGAGEPPLKTRKTPWQCRLRWCQLVEPLMPKEPILNSTEHRRSVALKLSRRLLETTATTHVS
ncbi:hypothetical protein BGZ75_002539 [Mortierella antarctica]|nr:hypothetical protein BGZ75_002539 [Mortierella antarctica]